MPVDASVLIPVLNEETHLRDAVARMRAQDFQGSLEFLFIDGGSTDSSTAILAELAAEDDRVRVLANPARRTPNALNVGLNAARGEFIVRMDAHTHYPPSYVRTGIERLRRHDGVVSVSGPQIAVGDGTWSRRVALALQTPLGVGGAKFRRTDDEEFEVDTGFTGCWERAVLLEHGGWDEGWPIDQDCELASRLAADGGHHVCVPSMAAEYIPRNSLKRLAKQYWWYGYYKAKTVERHPQSMRPSHLLPPGLAAAAAFAVLAPRPLRGAARAGLVLYAGVLTATAIGAARDSEPADAALLPAVFATMHVSYGFGALAGVRRFGVPTAALRGLLGRLAGRGR